jgi:hypothetical protein
MTESTMQRDLARRRAEVASNLIAKAGACLWLTTLIALCDMFGPDFARAGAMDEIRVCHGEYDQICRSFPIDIWERCGPGTARGADPNVTCHSICGTPPGRNTCIISRISGYPSSRSGNFCGYSWFAVRCVTPITSSLQIEDRS